MLKKAVLLLIVASAQIFCVNKQMGHDEFRDLDKETRENEVPLLPGRYVVQRGPRCSKEGACMIGTGLVCCLLSCSRLFGK